MSVEEEIGVAIGGQKFEHSHFHFGLRCAMDKILMALQHEFVSRTATTTPEIVPIQLAVIWQVVMPLLNLHMYYKQLYYSFSTLFSLFIRK